MEEGSKQYTPRYSACISCPLANPSRLSRSFSRDLSRLDADGKPERRGENDVSSEDESSEEESSEDDDPQSRIGQLPPVDESDDDEPVAGLTANLNSTLSTEAMTPEEEEERARALASAAARSKGGALTAEQIAQARKDRKAAGAQKKSGAAAGNKNGSDSDEGGNNRAGTRNMKLADLGAPKEMSRREREQAEKAAAKERYMKMHAAGKTDEARSDLARLAEIRKQREAANARRKAEQEGKWLGLPVLCRNECADAPTRRQPRT